MMDIRDTDGFGQLVKQARISKRLTQQELATWTDLNRSTIVDIEHGRNTSMQAALKVLEHVGLNLMISSPEPGLELLWTADAAARAIRRELRAGDRDYAMRSLIQAAAYFDRLDIEAQNVFLAAPASTGSKRWDAFLARTFAYKCRQHQMQEPGWTRIEPLTRTWYATARSSISPAWKQRMTRHTPDEFAEANIRFDVRSLATA